MVLGKPFRGPPMANHSMLWSPESNGYPTFGVYQGTSFSLALKACAKFFKMSDDDAPAFYAFDSFEGLPEVNPQMNGEMFEKGEYRASRKSFESRIRSPARGWKVGVVAGLFCHSLKDAEEVIREQGIKLTAFINVDCDLYESTVDVLKFITPLVQTGTVLFLMTGILPAATCNAARPAPQGNG